MTQWQHGRNSVRNFQFAHQEQRGSCTSAFLYPMVARLFAMEPTYHDASSLLLIRASKVPQLLLAVRRLSSRAQVHSTVQRRSEIGCRLQQYSKHTLHPLLGGPASLGDEIDFEDAMITLNCSHSNVVTASADVEAEWLLTSWHSGKDICR